MDIYQLMLQKGYVRLVRKSLPGPLTP